MTDKPAGKPLSSKAIEMMKPGDKNKSDTGENRGLRVACGASGIKTFFYRYTSPVTNKLSQVKIGSFPQTSLAMARMKLQALKHIRKEGRCPATELKEAKLRQQAESQKLKLAELTIEGLVELYLTERIEDRKSVDGKLFPGRVRKRGNSKYAEPCKMMRWLNWVSASLRRSRVKISLNWLTVSSNVV